MTHKKLNSILSLFICITFYSCVGIVYGDLSKENISEEAPKIVFNKIEFIDCEPIEIISNAPLRDITYEPDFRDGYKLQIHHTIPKEYTQDMATLITIFSLGILPFYHTIEGEIEYTIYKNEILVLKEKLNLEIKIFYGWLFIFTIDYFKSPNLVPINEGTGLAGAANAVVYERLGYRIQKKFSEKDNPPPEKKFWFW